MGFFMIPILFFYSLAHASFYKPPEPHKYEGDKPYTPTRIEWLTAYNQNECGVWLNGIPTVSWGLFNMIGTKDTVTVVVRFTDEKIRDEAQRAAETCARNIKATAHDRGWTWLKTNLEVSNRDVAKNPSKFKIKSIKKENVFKNLSLQKGETLKSINK